MKPLGWISLVLASLALLAGGASLGVWFTRDQILPSPAAAAPDHTPKTGPVAQVRVATIKRGAITARLIAYGTVVAAKGKGRTFSVPFESRVGKVLAVPGQEVAANAILLELAPSSPASLRLAQARSRLKAARQELNLLRQQMKLGMATRQQVLQGEKSLNLAELNLKSLEREGTGKPRIIRAQGPGLVSRVLVQAGQLVPAGSPLVETIGRADLEVRLGIESEDAGLLRVGQAVRLQPINQFSARVVSGRVRLITRQVDPQTRLVNVYVAPDHMDHTLLLHEYVRGTLVAASRVGLWVPPPAVLPCPDGSQEMFTVKEGRAVRCLVKKGLENAKQIQVSGMGLAEGQPVIVVGNSQVSDGMAVRAEPAQ